MSWPLLTQVHVWLSHSADSVAISTFGVKQVCGASGRAACEEQNLRAGSANSPIECNSVHIKRQDERSLHRYPVDMPVRHGEAMPNQDQLSTIHLHDDSSSRLQVALQLGSSYRLAASCFMFVCRGVCRQSVVSRL